MQATEKDSPPDSDHVAIEEVASLEEGQDVADSEAESENTEVHLTAPVNGSHKQLCSWEPKAEAILHNDERALRIRLKHGQTLTLLGEYRAKSTRGLCFLYGALLSPQKEVHVYASATHAIPTIECLSSEGTEILISDCGNGLRSLSQLSPLYNRLWNFRSKGTISRAPAVKDPRFFSVVCCCVHFSNI